MSLYIDGPECKEGINYYTLLITPPPVSKRDPAKPPLTPVEASQLLQLDGNFVVVDRSGKWLIWSIKAGIAAELNEKLLAALRWAETNCKAMTKDPSLHIGYWSRYSLHIFLSRDSKQGKGLQFIDQPGVHEFVDEIDRWFQFIDPQLYEEYCRITPDNNRVLGKSFLMAVLNHGGSKPHIDSEDRIDGCCCVVPVGVGWSGGELVFRDIHLKIKAQPGDIIFFRSAQLYHENLEYMGERRSIVLNTDANCFTASGQIYNAQYIEDERNYNAANSIELPPVPEWSVPDISTKLDTPDKLRSYLKNRIQLKIQNTEATNKNKVIQRKDANWQPRQFVTKKRSKKKGTKRHN